MGRFRNKSIKRNKNQFPWCLSKRIQYLFMFSNQEFRFYRAKEIYIYKYKVWLKDLEYKTCMIKTNSQKHLGQLSPQPGKHRVQPLKYYKSSSFSCAQGTLSSKIYFSNLTLEERGKANYKMEQSLISNKLVNLSKWKKFNSGELDTGLQKPLLGVWQQSLTQAVQSSIDYASITDQQIKSICQIFKQNNQMIQHHHKDSFKATSQDDKSNFQSLCKQLIEWVSIGWNQSSKELQVQHSQKQIKDNIVEQIDRQVISHIIADSAALFPAHSTHPGSCPSIVQQNTNQPIEAIQQTTVNLQEQSQQESLEQQSQDESQNCSNSTIYLDYDDDLNQQFDYIGLLICIKRSCQKISTSTAFLIDERTLATCIHSFEDQEGHFATDQIIFIPGCRSTNKQFRYQAYISSKDVFTTSRDHNFKSMKIGRELAILFLEKPIKVGTRIPPFKSYQSLVSNKIEIIGYPEPEISYNFITDEVKQQFIKRERLQGQYEKVVPEQHKIQYPLSTRKGFSGAPIIGRYQYKKGQNRNTIVGIHTCGSSRYSNNNCGLLFTEQIVKQIQIFMKKNPYDDRQCSDFDQSQHQDPPSLGRIK